MSEDITPKTTWVQRLSFTNRSKEIWEYQQKESEWIKTDNLFKGSQKIIEELSAKLVQQVRIISDLNYQITKLKKELADKNK